MDRIRLVCVDMGVPHLAPAEIPTLLNGNGPEGHVVQAELNVEETIYEVTCVNMGNPHAVIFMEDALLDMYVF